MTKQIFETTGQFEIVDFESGTVILAARPTIVATNAFLHSRAAAGQLRVIGDVSDDATDAEFGKYWSEAAGDKQLAIESFKAAFPSEGPKPEPEAPVKTRRNNRAPADTE